MDLVSKSPPDGYTTLIAGGTFWTFPLLQKASYDPVRGFSLITFRREVDERSRGTFIVAGKVRQGADRSAQSKAGGA